jgi:hypothetical protein
MLNVYKYSSESGPKWTGIHNTGFKRIFSTHFRKLNNNLHRVPTRQENVQQPGVEGGKVGVQPGAVGRHVRVAYPVAPVTPRQVVGVVVHLQLGQRHLPQPSPSIYQLLNFLQLTLSANNTCFSTVPM